MSDCVRLQVVVPSYKRREVLPKCLRALADQSFQDFSVLCVCRADDAGTREVVADFAAGDSRFAEILVVNPGVVAALNAGLRSASAEFVTFTDDDAVAPSHWLETIVRHFDAYRVCGAVGGQDRLMIDESALADPPIARQVGVFSWYGRVAATHHHPIEEPYLRCAMLKGVNMSFRHYLIANACIGDGLQGVGCTVGWEQGLCAKVTANNMQIHFVRDAWVWHFCAPRTCNDSRVDASSEFALAATFNSAYVLWRYQPICTAFRAHLWAVLVGSLNRPGLLRVVARPSLMRLAISHWVSGGRGLCKGLRDCYKTPFPFGGA